MERQRLSFQCCGCDRDFGQTIALNDGDELLLECPFCGEKCKVDIEPHRNKVVEIMRGNISIPTIKNDA